MEYEALGVEPFLVRALAAMAIKQPTPVQAACIPSILAGRDCIGQAQTGSGKTVAFAVPILQALARDPFGPFAIVLTPTRELAFQIHEQFAVLGAAAHAKTAVCVGGMDMIVQAAELERRPHVIIATPGRLADLLASNPTDFGLQRARFLVLDEADRLLEPSFGEDLAKIIGAMSIARQTLLFTATMSDPILALQRRPPSNGKQAPFLHLSQQILATPRLLRQLYVFMPAQVREVYLFYLLAHMAEHLDVMPGKQRRRRPDDDDRDVVASPPPTIIFVSRCNVAAALSVTLDELGLDNAALHSRRTQRERLDALASFRAGRVSLLVATDVGSRGLDIPEVECVINLDVPRNADDYIHRVGRTARAGRRGTSVTFVTEGDVALVAVVEERVGARLDKLDLPEAKVLETLNKVSTAQRVALMALNADKFGERQRNHAAKAKKLQQDSKKSKRRKADAPVTA